MTRDWERAAGQLERATARLGAGLSAGGEALREILAERQGAVDWIASLDPRDGSRESLERIRAAAAEGDRAIDGASAQRSELRSGLARSANLAAALTACLPRPSHQIDCEG